MNNPPWSDALNACLAQVAPPRGEEASRRDALGRLLLEPVAADRDYPLGDLSMMDGYAVGDVEEKSYIVAGENFPGSGSGLPLAPHTARRIFTGAELPAGATRVIPQEQTSREGDKLTINSLPDTAFVRAKGSEGKKGATILAPGTRIGPVEQALLATVGVGRVQVAVQPRVAHIASGSELTDPDSPEPGQLIRDSNSDLVAASLRGAGYPLVDQRRIGDDKAAIIKLVEEMSRDCELLLISGGASVGDHDYARAAIEAAGFRFETHGVDLRPGKPVGLARRDHQWAIALPGNPVSHLVTLHLFVLPLLRRMEGVAEAEPKLIYGILRETLSAPTPRRSTFWPATATVEDGALCLTPRRFLSSGDLIGIAGTNALIFFPAGVAIPPQGTIVPFLPASPHFASSL